MFGINRLSDLFGRTASPARKQQTRPRPAVESLEDRTTPSTLFASYPTGTFAYNTATHAWRQATTAQASQITEGSDGVMFGSYGSGTYEYIYSTNSWRKLTGAAASTLDAADDNSLYASFSNGTFEYVNGGWHQLTGAIATKLAAVNSGTFFGSYSSGTYRESNGQWSRLTTAIPAAMAADASGTLVASYGSGTYTWHNGWTQISTQQAKAVTSEYTPAGFFLVDPTSLDASFADGIYTYNVAARHWTKINSAATSILAREPGTGSVVGGYTNGTFMVGGAEITGAVATHVAS
jgi:hypothetical protein